VITECSVQRRWYINLDQLAINFIICVIVQTAVLCRPASNHIHACAPCAPRPHANRRPTRRYRCQARAGGGRHAHVQEARNKDDLAQPSVLCMAIFPSDVPSPGPCRLRCGFSARACEQTCQPQTIPRMSRPPKTPNCTHALCFSSLGLEVLLRCWRCRF